MESEIGLDCQVVLVGGYKDHVQSFQDEYRILLIENEMDFDEKFVWN